MGSIPNAPNTGNAKIPLMRDFCITSSVLDNERKDYGRVVNENSAEAAPLFAASLDRTT